MRMKRLCSTALGIVFFACVIPAGLTAQTSPSDVDQKIADLEKQLQAVRAELDTLKPKPVAPPVTRPEAPPTQEAIAAPATSPMAGINTVLGGVALTGLADVYYGYNANHPFGGTVTEPFLSTNSQFALNLIELQLDKVPDKTAPLGFRVALGFGQAIKAVNGTDGNLSGAQYLKEGYLSYMAPLGKGLQIDVGKFVTPMGAEVIETNQNWNYSRSLLFNYAIPYYHFGARAKYTINDKWSVTGFAMNGWNNIVDNNSGKTGGLSVGWNATKKLTFTETYLAGPEGLSDQLSQQGSSNNSAWRHVSDTVIAYNLNTKLALQANIDYGRQEKTLTTQRHAEWSGIAAYAKYAFNPKVALAGRYEYFNDHDGFTTGTAQHLNEFTGTVERKIAGHLISRLEVRHDNSNQNFFQRGVPSFVKGQTTVDAGLVFVLESMETK